MHLFEALLDSPDLLADCRSVTSLPLLLNLLRQRLALDLTDDALLRQLGDLNQSCLNSNIEALTQHWFPYHYDARSRNIQWCLSDGGATEPFHDQYVTRCRQGILLNQLLMPRTKLVAGLARQPAYNPAGFIFHLSRCGSTLLSGSFAELGQASVLSESPLLTEFLLDQNISAEEKRACLPDLVRWQATGGKTGSLNAVVKWNAWDIFQWPLIRAVYPSTPVVLLIRDPLEILASHQKSAGRHMVGDPSLARVHPVFTPLAVAPSEAPTPVNMLLNQQIRVLEALLKAFMKLVTEPGVLLVDYAQLASFGITQAMQHFQFAPGSDELERIQLRIRRHSKEPERLFTPDSQQKQQQFNAREQREICERLMPLYQQLLAVSSAVKVYA